jgi:hypothetical protein
MSFPCANLVVVVAMAAPSASPRVERPSERAERRPTALTADAIREMLRESQRAIRSLRVVYRASSTLAGGDSPRGAYIRREVVASAEGQFSHHAAHGYDGLNWEDDPLQQSTVLHAGILYHEYRLKRSHTHGRWPATAELPGTSQEELFFEYSGLWPFDTRPAPRPFGRAHVLREVAESDDYSRVRPYQERIDGRWCHVIEMPGNDSVWLDTERGACLMARELAGGDSGRRALSLTLGGHRQVAEGVWLPTWIESVQYDFRARTEAGRRRKVTQARTDILEISVNDISDTAFEFRPAAGSLSRNRDEPDSVLAQTVPGGLDYLDGLTDWIERRHLSGPKSPGRLPPACGYLAGLPFLGVILFLHLRGRRATRRC